MINYLNQVGEFDHMLQYCVCEKLENGSAWISESYCIFSDTNHTAGAFKTKYMWIDNHTALDVHDAVNHMQLNAGHFAGLVQDYSNSSANALELLQFCTKQSVLFTGTQSLSQNMVLIVSANGLLSLRRQAITWINAHLLWNGCVGKPI